MTVQDYYTQLDEYKEAGVETVRKARISSIRDPVAVTLYLSIQQIRRENTLAVDYLFLAACVD